MQKQSLTTYHKQTDAQAISEQQPPWSQTPTLPPPTLIFIAEHDIMCYDLVRFDLFGSNQHVVLSAPVLATNAEHSTVQTAVKKVN